MDWKSRCADCIALVQGEACEWVCDELELPCSEIGVNDCPEVCEKWYWFETRFRTLKDGLRNMLINNNMEYELSGSDIESWWHFEILITSAYQLDVLNDWIEENTITERSA